MLPCFQQHLHTLHSVQAAGINILLPALLLRDDMCRRFHKIRLHKYLFRPDLLQQKQLLPVEFRQADVMELSIDPGHSMDPGTDHAGQRLQPAAPVAFVPHRTQQAPGHTILASMPVPVKHGTGTQQPEIMNRLHHRNAAMQRCVIHRRADQTQGIMHMNDFDFLRFDQISDTAVGFQRKNRCKRQQQFMQRRHSLQLGVVTAVQNDPVAMLLQHLFLICHHRIFSAGDLIVVMDQEIIHFRVAHSFTFFGKPHAK